MKGTKRKEKGKERSHRTKEKAAGLPRPNYLEDLPKKERKEKKKKKKDAHVTLIAHCTFNNSSHPSSYSQL